MSEPKQQLPEAAKVVQFPNGVGSSGLSAAVIASIRAAAETGVAVQFIERNGTVTAVFNEVVDLETAGSMLPKNPCVRKVKRLAAAYAVPIIQSGKTPCINIRKLRDRMQGRAA